MIKTPDDWFETLSEEQQPLLEELRKLVFRTNRDFEETIKWGQPCYSLNSLVCYLNKFKSYVVLGFQQGAHLEDPKALLGGDGKNMRHVKVHTAKDIDKSAFKALVKEAIRLDKESVQ